MMRTHPEDDSRTADEPVATGPSNGLSFEDGIETWAREADGGAAAASAARRSSSASPPGASRIAGLVREIVAASYFGVSGPMSAFTIAFLAPNLVRSLFADAALQAAFVPSSPSSSRRATASEAFRLASTLIFLVDRSSSA